MLPIDERHIEDIFVVLRAEPLATATVLYVGKAEIEHRRWHAKQTELRAFQRNDASVRC